jgi:hypothetical protein
MNEQQLDAIAEILWQWENPMATDDAWEYMKKDAERDPYPYLLTRYYDKAKRILTALEE